MSASGIRTILTTSLALLAATIAGSGQAAWAIVGPLPATWTEPAKNTGTGGGALKGLTTQGCDVWAVGEESETTGNTWIERSTNGGRTWTLQSNPTPLVTLNKVGFDHQRGFAVGEPQEHPDATDPYAGPGTILTTNNGGRTWQDITAFGPAVTPDVTEDLEGLAVVNGKNVYAAGTQYGDESRGVILHSRNGRNFESQPLPTTEGIADVYFADSRRGWAVTDGGTVLVTTDGGDGPTGWTVQFTSSDRDAERIKFAADRTTGIVIGGNGQYATTSDGGAHWTERLYQPGGTEFDMKDVVFASNSHVWIASERWSGSDDGETAILESFNGGPTLVTDSTPAGDNMQGIGVLPNGAAIAVGAERHALVTGTSNC